MVQKYPRGYSFTWYRYILCAIMRTFLFGWFLNVLVNNYAISRTGPKTERLTILRAATNETERGDHDFCLSRSHYTDTDRTSRELTMTSVSTGHIILRERGDHDFCLRSHYTDTDPTSSHIILTPTEPVGSWETMTSVSAGHIILTPTQPVGSGWPQRESPPSMRTWYIIIKYVFISSAIRMRHAVTISGSSGHVFVPDNLVLRLNKKTQSPEF